MTVESPNLFPDSQYDLVVLAASAGGLPTVLEVLRLIPADFPAAMIFVQHMAPDRPSHLSHILGQKSPLVIKEAQDQDVLHPGILYVAPPNQHLGMNQAGVLNLSQTPPYHFHRPSVDRVLDSAAKAFGARLVAVILSGMGSDGSEGIQAVKAAGGFVIAEDPHTALFSGMPQAAIQTGKVDVVLPVDQIGPRLIQIVTLSDKV